MKSKYRVGMNVHPTLAESKMDAKTNEHVGVGARPTYTGYAGYFKIKILGIRI